ncbi:serine hydrolase domain-containing protein [Streptomyces lushanensis]|uniref:serine hydrolase domain-containing protein n=1 Tax=Streptomyces lushanensis TaxID=1434255 RepID=UPI00082ACF46|nr:serine hydrolase domain-containing protein [Streptomyces lushanensis]
MTSAARGTAYGTTAHDRPVRRPEWAHGPASAIAASARGASGVAVAIRQGGRRAVMTYGSSAYGGAPVTADTRFETGSLTKCLTALLLAELAARGDVSYGDPLTRLLPPGSVPAPRGGPITLLHLATHTSGLPRLPPGLLAGAVPHWFSNPYAGFRDDDLLRALARTRPFARPGERVRYSNFGVGLLGHLLGRAVPGRLGYGELLADRVLEPLGLHRTGCAPGLRQATGYWHGRARPPWRIPGLAGAGAVRSSARDLLTLLDALLDAAPDSSPANTPETSPDATRGVPPAPSAGDGSVPLPAPLRTALADVVRPRLALRGGTGQLALVWNIRVRPDGDVYHHSGGTRGFTAFAGFSPRHRTAVVALANTAPSPDGRFIQSAYRTLLSLPGRR